MSESMLYFANQSLSENDFTSKIDPLISENYVEPDTIKSLSEQIYTKVHDETSLIFIIKTISKNIMIHMKHFEIQKMITLFEKMEKNEFQSICKIYILKGNDFHSKKCMKKCIHYLYHLGIYAKCHYIGSLLPKTIIGINDSGIFIQSRSKL